MIGGEEKIWIYLSLWKTRTNYEKNELIKFYILDSYLQKIIIDIRNRTSMLINKLYGRKKKWCSSNSTSRTSLMNFLLEPASLKRSQCLTGTGEEERERERYLSKKDFSKNSFLLVI